MQIVLYKYKRPPLPVVDCTFYKSTIEDTHREKAASNKSPALTKSRNMSIWVVGTSDQIFIRGFQTETKFSKK